MDDRLTVHSLIKRGGMAEVFLASLHGSDDFVRRVALKRMLPGCVDIPGYRDGFYDESRILSQLSHSGIVNIVDFGELDGQPFQLLELVDGKDLTFFESPFDIRVALHLATEIAHALDYVHHAKGQDGRPLEIVHRDISASNVLVGWNGDVKLADFGIARAAARRSKTQVGAVKGKLSYAAPEQIRGESVDGRADQFALGCLLHSMLEGRSPMADPNVRERVYGGAACPVSSTLDGDLRAVVSRALAVDPASRFLRARDFADACSALLAARGTGDPRRDFREWLARARPPDRVPPAPGNALAALFDVAALKVDESARIRRYTAVEAVPITEEESHDAIAPPTLPLRPHADLNVGDRVNGYVLETHDGTIGDVRLFGSSHKTLGTTVGIQVWTGSSDARNRILEILQTFAPLRHDALAPILDGGTSDDAVFVIVDRPPGEPLEGVLADDHGLTLEATFLIAARLASAMAAVTAQGWRVAPPTLAEVYVERRDVVTTARFVVDTLSATPATPTTEALDVARFVEQMVASTALKQRELHARHVPADTPPQTWAELEQRYRTPPVWTVVAESGRSNLAAWVAVAACVVVGAATWSYRRAADTREGTVATVRLPPKPKPSPFARERSESDPPFVAAVAEVAERNTKRRAGRRPSKAPAITDSFPELERRWQQLLTQADATPELLALDPTLQRPVAQWTNARAANDASKAGAAVDDLADMIDRFDPRVGRIEQHLEGAKERLQQGVRLVPPSTLDVLEEQFFRLRTRASRGVSSRAERIVLARDAVELARDINRATTTPNP